MNRGLWLLVLCQGLFLTNNVVLVAINGLLGWQLAPSAWMATLPLTGYVAGGALAAPLAARHQRRVGRRRGFQTGLLVAIAASAICAFAAWQRSFALLLLGTIVAGYYQANASLYRFAAAELVDASAREKAISWVLAGGIAGGVLGPGLASATQNALAQPFTGSYLALIVVAVVALVVVSMIRFPPLPTAAHGGGRPLREIAGQPVFIVAVAAAALGYGVMNLLMAATPIAMAQCGHPFGSAAMVLQWHVLGMFVPSFFTGHLIRRFGALPVMTVGLALNAGCVVFALTGTDLAHFVGALTALGVGWNFLYTGGTALLADAHRPEERTTAQGAMDTCVFATMALTSFSSGALVTTGGWTSMNLGSLLPLALLALALSWLAWQRPAAPNRVVREGG